MPGCAIEEISCGAANNKEMKSIRVIIESYSSKMISRIAFPAFVLLSWCLMAASASGAVRGKESAGVYGASSVAPGSRWIVGQVTDSVTGEVLPFANLIYLPDRKRNAVANENGSFRVFSYGNPTGWRVEYTGYEPKGFPATVADTAVVIRLSPASQALQEVVVRPRKEKYSKKNNPAVDFVRRLRAESGKHDPKREPFYSYDKYEKTLLALNEFNGDFSGGFLGGKGKFLKDYVDTSSWTGKRILDLIIKEKASTHIRSRKPGADKEIVRGYRSAGLDEVLSQENMQLMLEDVVREMDIYGNDIIFMTNRFVSPLSSIGPDFYKYYLTDTVYVGSDRCIELSFAPHNPESMGFNGKIYVPVGDTTMFVKKVTMRVPQAINLNYVDNIFVNLMFEKDSLGNRHKTYDDICMEMRIAPGTPRMYIRKTTSYDNFSYDMREDLRVFYGRLGNAIDLEGARSRDGEFWSAERMVPMTVAESRMGNMMGEMRKVPLLYWAEKAVGLMESGYVRTGNPSKVDLGPVNTLLSGNTVEGLRIRLGGMTMSPLNPHLFAKGYVAYGTRDKKWKYKADVEYSFTPKKHHSFEWPRHGFYGSMSYDLDMIGQHYLFTSQDNVFLSLKRKESVLVTYRRLAKFGYILELPNNFSVEAGLSHERQEATQWLPFTFADGRSISEYRQSSFNVTVRWAPGEKFIQGRTLRIPINLDAWVIQLTHEFGPKGFMGADFTLNRSEISVQKRLWLSAFGYTDIILKAGKVWSGVYYPALMWPNANLSYTIQPESYSLMNAMEFANDRYAAIDFTYFGNGILFNRLPLLKKLKIREAVTFKGLWGGLSDRNNPALNASLPLFPAQASPRVMKSTPYMEIGAGIDNILTFLRVDYVWRLTYRDTPGCDKSGVRVSLHFNF